MTTTTKTDKYVSILALAGLCGGCVYGIEPDGLGAGGGLGGVGGGGDFSTVGVGGSGSGDSTGVTTSSSTSSNSSSSVTAASSSATTGAGGAGGSGSTSSTAASSSATGGSVMGLTVQYKADNTPSNNSINPHFRVANTGSSPIDLNGISIRYWFTKEAGSMNQVFHCDWAKIDCGNVGGKFTAASGMNADHYLEVSLTGGTVAAGANSGPIQIRFNKADYSMYNEKNDYSYDASKTAFAAWDKVTAYSGGQLIWGTEP